MKVQELLEMNQNAVKFETIDEFYNFIDSKTRGDSDMYHFEEITGPDGNQYDIIVRVETFNSTPGRTNDTARAETPEDLHGDTEIEWNMVAYGSGNFDTDTDFWIKEGSFELDNKTSEFIEDKLIEDQSF